MLESHHNRVGKRELGNDIKKLRGYTVLDT
jgi:hypothetical protein